MKRVFSLCLLVTMIQLVLAQLIFAAPILDAAKDGDTAAVQAAIDAGVNVNGADIDGNTPLNWAVNYGHANVVTLLLADSRVDFHTVNTYGKTPQQIAIGLHRNFKRKSCNL